MESGLDRTSLSFVDMFEAAEQATQNARETSEKCRDYYDSKQWTENEVQELRRRKQPIITDNVIAGKINWLLGQEMNRRTDPKAFPRTPQHEEGADAATDAIRFVCDNVNFDEKRSAVWENMLIEGYGGVEVIHRMKRNQPEIEINHYQWDRLFYDPHSRKADFSDARYVGSVIWADRKQVERQYKGKDLSGAMQRQTSLSDTYEDRPAYQVWGDKERDRVRVCLMHYKEGEKWKWVKFSYGVVLEEGESPYVDEDGESVCQLLMQSAYVDRDNNRYSEVLKLLDQQDEINKRRSKLLHMANSRQTIGIKGAVKSVADMKRELARPDGHVEVEAEAVEDAARVGMKPFEIQQTADMATSQFALLQESKQSIEDKGATEALQGAGNGESGRAVLARQQGAMQSLTPLNDKLSQFTRRVYEAIWQRVRQFWTQERWVRVTDDERNVRFVGLNRPVTLREKLSEYPQEQVQQFAYQNALGPQDPRLDQVVGIANPIEGLEVDIILEEVPDMVTLEAETFEQIVNIDSARGGVLPIQMIIKAAPLRSKIKNEILEFFEQQQEAQQQGQQPMQEAQQAMFNAELQEKNSKAMQNVADANKTAVETQRLAMGY
ncbi:hypothetical protein [Ruegeria sp. HKCCD6109]|uniref:portal protein n=1 Tax=Ruegeria sp. HKCCD6109 TaxID=2683017 RepID=UPI001491F419|nr:hypothetical protein [Ruegeria sp. HKCCD6109]NOD65804.1 hypothetical protein [Ruegeria sp. HKCCD6109]